MLYWNPLQYAMDGLKMLLDRGHMRYKPDENREYTSAELKAHKEENIFRKSDGGQMEGRNPYLTYSELWRYG